MITDPDVYNVLETFKNFNDYFVKCEWVIRGSTLDMTINFIQSVDFYFSSFEKEYVINNCKIYLEVFNEVFKL